MSKSYDPHVIVVGSGPSGVATAISCALKGLKVVIIESESFPRYRPGETLHPGIDPLLKELGVIKQVQLAGFIRHRGHWIKWDGEQHFAPFNEATSWLGYQAFGSDFDAILLERAISLGVEVLQPCRALRPLVSNNRVIGVLTSNGEIRASVVVDATGRRQWLAHKLKLKVNIYSPQLIAYFGYMEGDCPKRDNSPSIVADNKGWTWTARVRPQIYQWTRLSFVHNEFEKEWRPKEFRDLKSKGQIKGADVTWRAVDHPGGPGYYLVGDAATVLDPASSHGVLKALMSGMMVAHLVGHVLISNQDEGKAIKEYCNWVYKWFNHDVKKLRKLYGLLGEFQRNSQSWL
ncbi:NAD(P)/FAD-dependent oxidoreductase [Bacillus subtilis]|nr:NAD(P)/FAD-dependent oxidoreductase [Bacillus subtilis]